MIPKNKRIILKIKSKKIWNNNKTYLIPTKKCNFSPILFYQFYIFK
jgi:hypothetical protein